MLLELLASVALTQPLATHADLVPVVGEARRPAYIRKPTRQEMKEMAREIESRLQSFDRRLKDENAAFERASLDLLRADRSKEDIARVLEKYPQAPVLLEMTILARRLEVYKTTGELPADIPDREAIRKLLTEPWKETVFASARTGTTRAFELEKDIVKLERQIQRYARLAQAAGPPPAAAHKPRTQELPKAPAIPLAGKGENEGSAVELAKDAGRGREEVDPIPPLLAQLSSPEPRLRALAADELGQHGAAARPALGALRGALADPDARVRASAAQALGALGPLPAEGTAALEAALQDKSQDVRFSARLALERLRRTPR